MYLYQSLSKRGFDVRFVKPRGNRIELEDLDASIDGKTKLVALSLVSYMNGFQHDLKAVCNAAHAKGALVYADLVQAAGAVPVDVRDAGVDFCACSGYKWLMGDKGLGFLYVRKDLLGSRVHRTQFGEDQMINYLDHLYPTDPPVGEPASWSQLDDAGGYFEVGSVSTLVAAGLIPALEYLNSRTIAAIQAARRPLMQRLMQEVPKLGYACITPTPDTGIISFLAADRHLLEPKMKAARVSISFIEHTMRISPSVYNTHADIDRLLHVLAG
jgi:selenocysteine lyase/cysteine desulfurase